MPYGGAESGAVLSVPVNEVPSISAAIVRLLNLDSLSG